MVIRRLALLLALCVGGAAHAQGFEGLDLTDDAPTDDKKTDDDGSDAAATQPNAFDAMEGLDLTDDADKPPVPPELRPSIAILGVVAGDDDKITVSRADQVSSEMVQLAGSLERFTSVSDPQLVQQQLGEGYKAALACDGWACFDAVAKKLKVHRLLLAVVTKSGAGSSVALKGFDPAVNEVLGAAQDSQEKAERSFAGFAGKSQAKKDKAFLKKMSPFLKNALAKLSTPNGKLVLDNVETTSVVTIDGLSAGTGSVEAVVQRGRHTVKVTAAGYLPFEQELTVAPLEVANVRVGLVAKPLDKPLVVEKPAAPSGPPLLQRPGTYVALAGVALAATGAILGTLAKGVEGRAVDTNGDGIVEVTRQDIRNAQGQAMVGNVLMAAGGAVAAGGVVWIFVTPAEKAVSAEPTEGGGFGVHLGVGGTF